MVGTTTETAIRIMSRFKHDRLVSGTATRLIIRDLQDAAGDDADLLPAGMSGLPRRAEGRMGYFRLPERGRRGRRFSWSHQCEDPSAGRVNKWIPTGCVRNLPSGLNCPARGETQLGIRRDKHQHFQPLVRVILHPVLFSGRRHGSLPGPKHLLL